MITISAIYFKEEQKMGSGLCVVNHDFPGHREQVYYAPFTLSEADTIYIENIGPINKELRKQLKSRIKESVSNKGYTFHTVHWNSQLVLYFKRNPNGVKPNEH
jgi:hypothetical protein